MAEAQKVSPQPRPEVSVRTNGSASPVGYVEGMTVQQAVVTAGMKTGWTTKYFVNGVKVRSSHVLHIGDSVTLAPRIRNGS